MGKENLFNEKISEPLQKHKLDEGEIFQSNKNYFFSTPIINHQRI